MTAVDVVAGPTPAPAPAPPTVGRPGRSGRSGRPGRSGRVARLAGHLTRATADLVALTRPRQWIKNLFAVPLALLDAPVWSATTLARIGWAVLLFTLASSLVYAVNDVADRRLDRGHPVKRARPVASGRISPAGAALFAAVLGALLILAITAGPAMSWWPLAAYLGLNLAYSRWLKHVPLLDICVVAAGFVLRVVLGYAATGGPVAVWLLTSVFATCLVLILGKRRQELAVAGATHRPALRGYNLGLVDQLLTVNATVAVVGFLLYLRSEAPVGVYRNALLLAAVPLTLFGVSRYLQAVLVRRGGGDPVRTLLRDRFIVATTALLAAVVGVALFAAHHQPSS
ncbi:UbiA prenyltransferase family protein [Solwaraspora sp. WMMD406]|uniref:UbiA prenyltransferase family protein n=1 Tax=Solwaraspora sp. WMMD406 TaxID=3016095 RepID=UPI0024170540|nr:UbiA prenyltransferase family protein [Solwaraspora sp. WMMD406]MDG4766357.1 UbiA prenyltransferase family protein [Solwaraspora sp. WMMD406]